MAHSITTRGVLVESTSRAGEKTSVEAWLQDTPPLHLVMMGLRFATSIELMRALWRGPYWWLIPTAVILLPAGVVFVMLKAVPLVAPFVYTVF